MKRKFVSIILATALVGTLYTPQFLPPLPSLRKDSQSSWPPPPPHWHRGEQPVDMLEINESCPNVKEGGIAFGQNPKAAEDITRAVKKYAKQPVIMKLSPNVIYPHCSNQFPNILHIVLPQIFFYTFHYLHRHSRIMEIRTDFV